MHRSNPLGWVSGALFLGALLLAWWVLQDVSVALKILLGIAYFVVLSSAGFWMWQHGQRRARLIEDIPTSRIATAPQGYVELLGQAAQIADMPLLTGLSGTTCLWYRWQVERRGDVRHARHSISSLFAHFIYWPESSETSQAHFGIEDGSGMATIFPNQAEMITAQRQVWHEGDLRYTEELIRPGDALYVLGDFSTHNPGQVAFDRLDAVAAKISAWRADPPTLLQRFDRNGNGTLDADEWEAMHHAAIGIARQQEAAVRAQPMLHRITAPDQGRLYLLSTRPPQNLAGHYRFWRSLGLGFFLGGGALALWLGGLSLLR